MKRGRTPPIPQACVIPYRIAAGRLEVCVVTSMRKRRWVFPKGVVESGETEAETAVKEAWEEAGLRGRLTHEPVGVYERRKWGIELRVTCFLMQVEECRRTWQESTLRKRRWIPAAEALILLGHEGQREMLSAAQRRLEPRRSRAG